MNYAPRKDLVAGSVAYFPEGTFYGPQRMAGESLVLLLQLGGASGQGFMRYEDLQAGHATLAARGTFAGGIYRGPDGRPRDGYEAVWEHVHGRPIAYPPPRFEEPILMWPAHCPWVPSRDEPDTWRWSVSVPAGSRTAWGSAAWPVAPSLASRRRWHARSPIADWLVAPGRRWPCASW